ncbi:Por secretion system C-terminal sorting domain-containing protein [Belliella buryatensis]|uniref:Por secretion system C-terminal sorting domain-containing protein n=1 Tax=Belliella buryatensis TaxID=1500549 RepID=A0A239EW62_9BACT|nr:T9SS type A sorting domain-containing protein [Belliella buryatensis]SNS48916.1 Por secretion system C-terminal sorting domain-containing protein [Belliella buryatensis]
MKNFTILFSIVFVTLTNLNAQTQMNLPVNFNEANVNYGVIGFEGAENSEIVEDPTDANNKVVRVVRSNTAATFAGTTVTAVTNGVQTGFASPIPFTATDTRMSVRVWSPDAGIQVRLKVEDFQDPTKSVETEATSTVAGDWETLVFNFANQATGTEALNLNNNFNKATIFFNFGVDGPTAGEKTYFFDDMAFVTGGGDGGGNDGGGSGLPTIPVDFESDELTYEFLDFEGGVLSRIANPQINDDNNSAFVGQMVKGPGAVFAGSVMPLASPMDFSQGKTLRVKVFMPRVGAKLLFKVENQNNPDINFERELTGTVANQWETLDFDYSAINTAQSYQKIVLIFDLGTSGDGSANFTYLIDDIQIVDTAGDGGGETDPNQMDLPVTFYEEEINYGVIGFEGAENSEIVEDPTDANNKVVRVVRSNTAATFAGTTVTAVTNGVQTGFASPIPFTATDTRMSVRVWSPDAGIQVRLKVEDFQDPTKSVETEATSTVAGDWETLVFNFANQATGTEALNLNNNFNKATIFFNFGVDGPTAGEKTYFFDDMIFGEPDIDECDGLETPSISISGQGTEVITLTSSSEEGNQWFLDGNPIEGATSQSIEVSTFGVFAVQVTIGDCISEFSDNVSLIVNSLEINPNREVKVYPNPVENTLNISGLQEDVRSLQVFDVSGRLLPITFEYQDGLYQGNVANLGKGLYILWIQQGNRSFPIKVMKK